jgi:hypothetical protein
MSYAQEGFIKEGKKERKKGVNMKWGNMAEKKGGQ